MKYKKTFKTKPLDEVTIKIECEGREPIEITVKPTEKGNRFVYVQGSAGSSGTIADPLELENQKT